MVKCRELYLVLLQILKLGQLNFARTSKLCSNTSPDCWISVVRWAPDESLTQRLSNLSLTLHLFAVVHWIAGKSITQFLAAFTSFLGPIAQTHKHGENLKNPLMRFSLSTPFQEKISLEKSSSKQIKHIYKWK